MTERRITTKEVLTDEWIVYNYLKLSKYDVQRAIQRMLEQGNLELGRSLEFVPVKEPLEKTKTVQSGGINPKDDGFSPRFY